MPLSGTERFQGGAGLEESPRQSEESGPHFGPQSALVVKNPPANTGDTGVMSSIPGSGRSSGEGRGNPLQYSCLENLRDRGAWWATIHGVAKGLSD